jgi:ADP-heptose:LPS heptosyltransferase
MWTLAEARKLAARIKAEYPGGQQHVIENKSYVLNTDRSVRETRYEPYVLVVIRLRDADVDVYKRIRSEEGWQVLRSYLEAEKALARQEQEQEAA